MKILAFDSSATVASVAVTEDEKLLGEVTLNNGNTHSQTLLPMAESLFRMLSISASDIDLFACSQGPGSFTGVRIGAATLKGMAFGREKPCVGVSTLEALAYNIRACKGIICPVMNARRSQVYTAIFESDGEKLVRLTPDEAISAAELDEKLSVYGSPVYLSGDGVELVKGIFKLTEIAYTPEEQRYQSAYSVARVALEAYLRDEYTSDSEIGATYLRLSQAERERLEKENKYTAE